MISAPAAQITSSISESSIIIVHGEERPNYGITQAAMMSVIFTMLIIWTACGNENKGSHFELAKAAGVEETDKLGEKQREVEEGSVDIREESLHSATSAEKEKDNN